MVFDKGRQFERIAGEPYLRVTTHFGNQSTAGIDGEFAHLAVVVDVARFDYAGVASGDGEVCIMVIVCPHPI